MTQPNDEKYIFEVARLDDWDWSENIIAPDTVITDTVIIRNENQYDEIVTNTDEEEFIEKYGMNYDGPGFYVIYFEVECPDISTKMVKLNRDLAMKYLARTLQFFSQVMENVANA